jgi:prepilin-type N-terminal cleavage/methylation domain-containing protein
MLSTLRVRRQPAIESDGGFSLAEMLVAVSIFLVVSGLVTSGLLQATNSQRRIANRVDMHAGVRSATELLQQEVGQAGRIALPGTATISGGVAAGSQAVGVSMTINGATAASVSGLFVGEQVVIDAGDNQEETVTLTAVDTAAKQITATFANAHNANVPLTVFGGFASGIVPPQPGFPNGSTDKILKLYGDINGDGNMVYVEYTCDPTNGYLYRNSMAYDAANKPAVTSSQSLLDNIQANPGGTACFTYMPNPLPVVNGNTYVLDVAVTLTVRTEAKDPTMNVYQTETKALLNVSPRNVFQVWQLASAPVGNRVQPMPASVTNLLP